MNQTYIFTVDLVGTLKGAPLSILILLMISGEPQNAKFLKEYSGYSDKVVQDALLKLQHKGLITRNNRYAWQLSTYASQLPLMAQIGPESVAGVENGVEDPSLMTSTGSEPVAGEMDPESEPSSHFDTENIRVGNSVSLARVFNLDSSNSRDSRKEILASDPEKLRILSAALERYGIREPARSRLARLPDMTLERIEYHCSTCSPGQAIYRIEHNWPMPQKTAEPVELFESMDCEVDQDQQEPPDLPQEVLEAWDKTLVQLRGTINQAQYKTYLCSLQIGDYGGGCLVLRAANEWVFEKLHGLGIGEIELGQVFSSKLGSQVSVRFEVGRLWS